MPPAWVETVGGNLRCLEQGIRCNGKLPLGMTARVRREANGEVIE